MEKNPDHPSIETMVFLADFDVSSWDENVDEIQEPNQNLVRAGKMAQNHWLQQKDQKIELTEQEIARIVLATGKVAMRYR